MDSLRKSQRHHDGGGIHQRDATEGWRLGLFEEVGGDHWDGDCFVFDQRVAVNSSLEESEVVVCYACREPLSVAEQSSPDYAVGRSCPYCIDRLNLTPITDEG